MRTHARPRATARRGLTESAHKHAPPHSSVVAAAQAPKPPARNTPEGSTRGQAPQPAGPMTICACRISLAFVRSRHGPRARVCAPMLGMQPGTAPFGVASSKPDLATNKPDLTWATSHTGTSVVLVAPLGWFVPCLRRQTSSALSPWRLRETVAHAARPCRPAVRAPAAVRRACGA